MPTPAQASDQELTEPRLRADIAYEALRDRIVTLQIKPGEPIDEDQLGRELGLGRTPLREAIERLALEQLVAVFPRRGTFASDITITDLGQISDVRATIEAHAAGRAAERLNDPQRHELAALVVELETRDSISRSALMALDARVHRFIFRCADNPYLAETCDRYLNLSLRIWQLALDRMPDLTAHVSEHLQILEAISDGDADRARDTIRRHIQTFEEEIRSVL